METKYKQEKLSEEMNVKVASNLKVKIVVKIKKSMGEKQRQ